MVNCIVIDDDQDIVELFSDLLNAVNIKTIATGNDGKKGVELYEKHKPNIVFTDIEMPKYDGFYVVKNIKEKYPNAEIVVITGNLNARNSDLLKSLRVPIINKPFNIQTIQQKITEILLAGGYSSTPFEIQYKFKEDSNFYSCVVTYEQYKNFKNLPIIEECEVVNNNQKNIESYQNEMQKALDLAVKNDSSHIRKLSDIVQ